MKKNLELDRRKDCVAAATQRLLIPIRYFFFLYLIDLSGKPTEQPAEPA